MEFLTTNDLSSFVIRLWRDDDRGQWRGHITHVQSHQGCYFLTMNQMEEFMARFFSNMRNEMPQPSISAANSG